MMATMTTTMTMMAARRAAAVAMTASNATCAGFGMAARA
jgi:hypothetical protein